MTFEMKVTSISLLIPMFSVFSLLLLVWACARAKSMGHKQCGMRALGWMEGTKELVSSVYKIKFFYGKILVRG